MTKIAIIGAGPSGLFLALYLARHSALFKQAVSLTLFEREAHHDEQDRSNPERSYTIDITGHGLKAVNTLGTKLLSRFDRELIPFRGIHAYAINKTLAYKEKGWTGSRGDICSALLHELEEELADSADKFEIRLNWRAEVSSVLVSTGELKWRDSKGNAERNECFDMVVGADGGGSMLRLCMQEQGLLSTQKLSIANYSRILHLDHNSAERALEPSLLHGFSLNPWAVGGAILDVSSVPSEPALDIFDQTQIAKKFYVQMGYGDEKPYPDQAAAESILKAIKISRAKGAHDCEEKELSLSHYVSSAELASFTRRPVYHTGKTVKCSVIAAQRCALLGDASTAFPPVGQGVNAALEGAATLAECLVEALGQERSEEILSQSFDSYNRRWLAQGHACADIANTVVYGSFWNRTKLILQSAFTELTGIDLAAAQLAKDPRLSYVEALRKSRVRNGIVLGVTALSVAALFLLVF